MMFDWVIGYFVIMVIFKINILIWVYGVNVVGIVVVGIMCFFVFINVGVFEEFVVLIIGFIGIL